MVLIGNADTVSFSHSGCTLRIISKKYWYSEYVGVVLLAVDMKWSVNAENK